MENIVEVKAEFWLWTALKYPFRLVASVLSALSMDNNGLSLKKILAAYSTYLAGEFTKDHLSKENTIILVLMWLVYAGILIGIYSISDISDAMSKVKGTVSGIPTPTKKEDNANPPAQ